MRAARPRSGAVAERHVAEHRRARDARQLLEGRPPPMPAPASRLLGEGAALGTLGWVTDPILLGLLSLMIDAGRLAGRAGAAGLPLAEGFKRLPVG